LTFGSTTPWLLRSLKQSRRSWKRRSGFYRAAVALRPESPGERLNLGSALKDKGDIAVAIAMYHEAIRLKKDYAGAHASLGMALRHKGDVDGAITECREAIRLKDDFSEAHHWLGL